MRKLLKKCEYWCVLLSYMLHISHPCLFTYLSISKIIMIWSQLQEFFSVFPSTNLNKCYARWKAQCNQKKSDKHASKIEEAYYLLACLSSIIEMKCWQKRKKNGIANSSRPFYFLQKDGFLKYRVQYRDFVIKIIATDKDVRHFVQIARTHKRSGFPKPFFSLCFQKKSFIVLH